VGELLDGDTREKELYLGGTETVTDEEIGI
jgi:hypothetical protein